ncbi:MAG: helix-turn-helix domain-containing protein [Fimbriimonadaceae bacterium]|nr:helix-turn-helix domain-containing protein [Fimbriimonadaceae bacterium]
MKLSYTLTNAAELLDVSRRTLERLIREGRIRAHTLTVHGDRHVSHAELERYVALRENAVLEREASR